jgi:hypothetical protein
MPAPANQSTSSDANKSNQLESPLLRVKPFEQLGGGCKVLHKGNLDFVPSGLGIFSNAKPDQHQEFSSDCNSMAAVLLQYNTKSLTV